MKSKRTLGEGWARLLSTLLGVLVLGCATMSTSPDVRPDPNAAGPRVGVVEFDGNRDYLPEPLKALAGGNGGSETFFRYRAEVEYDETDLSVLAFFNPLTLIGCPTGSVTVTANANLEVVRGGHVLANYSARSAARRVRTIYGGESLSRLRARALQAAAASIAAQLLNDPGSLATVRRERTAN